jgi:hypothetical protein
MAKATSVSRSKQTSRKPSPRKGQFFGFDTEAEYQRDLRRRRMFDPKLRIKTALKYLTDKEADAVLESIMSMRPDLRK